MQPRILSLDVGGIFVFISATFMMMQTVYSLMAPGTELSTGNIPRFIELGLPGGGDIVVDFVYVAAPQLAAGIVRLVASNCCLAPARLQILGLVD